MEGKPDQAETTDLEQGGSTETEDLRPEAVREADQLADGKEPSAEEQLRESDE